MEKERRSWSIAAEENQVRGGGGDEGEDGGGGGGGGGGDVHLGGQRIDGVPGHCHQRWPSNFAYNVVLQVCPQIKLLFTI